MIVCPLCRRVRISPGMRMRRTEGNRTIREETWAKLFEHEAEIAEAADLDTTFEARITVTVLPCPECERKYCPKK